MSLMSDGSAFQALGLAMENT